jgi:hypothetical protein
VNSLIWPAPLTEARLEQAFDALRDDIAAVFRTTPVLLGTARPPLDKGLYVLQSDEEVIYVGQALGSKGLRDRLLSKHLSGDDSHALQRGFAVDFPDRSLRRAYLKEQVLARWIVMNDAGRVAALEQLLIWLYRPKYNLK